MFRPDTISFIAEPGKSSQFLRINFSDVTVAVVDGTSSDSRELPDSPEDVRSQSVQVLISACSLFMQAIDWEYAITVDRNTSCTSYHFRTDRDRSSLSSVSSSSGFSVVLLA